MSGINDPTQIPQAPPAGVIASDRSGSRVWSRTGDRSPIDSSLTRTQPIKPISPIQITQARKEVAELRGMVRALLAITTRLEQTEREFAEHRASIQDGLRSQTNLLPRTTNGGAFGTPYFSNARSGHYAGDNSLNNPYTSPITRSLSFNGTGENPTRTQGSPITPLRTNGVTGRANGVRFETPPSDQRASGVHHTTTGDFEIPDTGIHR
ncbi:hypothetical protein Rs2_38337 [Raphanus sativus]|nr:hypothetical protein Rs2_38337 [Raphanus sativus]